MSEITRCPKCGARPDYIQGGQYHCMMCSTTWPINGSAPIVIKKDDRALDDSIITNNETEVKDMASKKGKCRNCGREKNITADGLCGGCYFAVQYMDKGTPEYDAALASAKARFTDPNFKSHGGSRKRKKEVSTGKIVQAKKHSLKPRGKSPIASALLCSKKISIESQICGAIMMDYSVIKKITVMRDLLLDKAEKFTQALELLS